ncbi:retrovirus-related pol polyprotein from transposon TNT 1-94 [Tanacetum coccineum]
MTGAKFDIEKFDGTGDFGLWRIKMRALLIQHGCEAALEVLPADMEAEAKAELNKKAHSAGFVPGNKLYLKKKLYTFYMPAGRKISEHIDEFNKIVLDLANIRRKIRRIRSCCIKYSLLYQAIIRTLWNTLLYGREALTLEDVMATLNSKEIQARQAQALLDLIMDSGCSYHMTPRLDILFDFLERDGAVYSLVTTESVKSEVPGCYLEQEVIIVYSLDGHAMAGELNASVEEKDSLAQVWHKRLGHINEAGLQVLEKQGLFGKEILRGYGFISSGSNTKHLESSKSRSKLSWIRSPSTAIEKKTPMEMWSGHPSDYGMLRIFGCVAYPHDKQVTSKNVVFNESVMYKDTLKDSGVGDKSVEELQEDRDDEDAGDQETNQPPDLTEYQLVRDREPRTRTKPLRFRDESNMAAYAFIATEEEDTDEPLTYQEQLLAKSLPPGYEQGNKICLLKKSLYGLKRSPRQWYKRIDEYMLSNGFKHSNDMMITCKSKAEIGSTKSLLKKEFDIKELEEAKKFLTMGQIGQDGHWWHCKMSLRMPGVARGQTKHMAVSVVRQYLANPGTNSLEAVKWSFEIFRGFVDSDYAKDPDKGRSITGYEFLVHGCVVSWKEMLQHVVALSTTEAEYMALTEAVKEAIWLRGLLEELGVELNTVAVNCDNQGAIHLSRNHVFHERTKHINVRYHFIREVLEAKTVKVLKVGTEHNAADALTKVVPGRKLQHCLELLKVGQEVSQLDKLEEWYNSYLSKIASGSNEKPKMVYPYRRVITGFAAKMSNEQAKVMENLDGVLFRALLFKYRSRKLCKKCSVFEQAMGTASGNAPLAHLAMYKVCATFGCLASDIFVGTDTTIEDGANVISLSLGGPPVTFYNDLIAIGAFTAIKSWIFVSCSAGNYGPHNKTLSNEAPWILTVGASKTDRRIRTTVTLGNKKILNGEALYQPKNYKPKVWPLVYPAGMGYSCTREELKLIDVKGKIVLCDVNYILVESAMGEAVKEAGGAAMIIVNDKLTGNSVAVEVQVLPSSRVGYREGVAIKKYLNSTSAPVATIIQRGTLLGVKSSPQLIVFSSRGPNHASPGILKPDIVRPGDDILAAWHKSVDNKQLWNHKLRFTTISQHSMPCPPPTCVAALIKTHTQTGPHHSNKI